MSKTTTVAELDVVLLLGPKAVIVNVLVLMSAHPNTPALALRLLKLQACELPLFTYSVVIFA